MSNQIPGGIKVIRGARNKYKDLKQTKLLYMTYVLTFPDGEHWMRQREFSAHDMVFEIKRMIAEHSKNWEWRQRGLALYHAGECWWKDEAGVEHLIMIEERPRKKSELRWGIAQAGMGSNRQDEKVIE